VENQTCNINGQVGVVTREGDRCYCKPLPALNVTRSGASLPRRDSMSADDAAEINGKAYREYLDRLHNAWK
jgi:hypothetical protein